MVTIKLSHSGDTIEPFDTQTFNFAPKWKPRSHAHGPPWSDKSLRLMLRQLNRAWHTIFELQEKAMITIGKLETDVRPER